MILINKDSTNTVILTLTEKVSIDTPTFLFKFTNDLTKNSVLFIATDSSNYTDRYNRFTITETSTIANINLLNGIISLNNTGYWNYKVFEQSSTTNLLESSTGALVESGKVLVKGTVTNHAAYATARTYKGYGQGSI